MHSKIDVPKKSKRLIIWNGGSRLKQPKYRNGGSM